MSPIMDQLQYPAIGADLHDVNDTPMSRTHQYRKVMKPLLERKRRARINKCLDELKDLMVYALQSEGESITKLEKADVLELTVRHLQKLKRQQMLQANPALDADRYRSGFSSCANEVSRCLASIPGVDVTLGTHLMTHLGMKLKTLDQPQQQEQQDEARLSPLLVSVPQSSAKSSSSSTSSNNLVIKSSPKSPSDGGYSSGRESVSPRSSISEEQPLNFAIKQEKAATSSSVWRPF